MKVTLAAVLNSRAKCGGSNGRCKECPQRFKSLCRLFTPPLPLCFLGDDTLKMWDIRSFRQPVNVATGLTNYFSM